MFLLILQIMLNTTLTVTYREKNETARLGAVLIAIPDKVTVTIQLYVGVLESL